MVSVWHPCGICVPSVWHLWSREVGFEGELRFCWLQRYQTFWRSAPKLGNICQLDQMYSLLIMFQPLVLLQLWIVLMVFFSHGVTNKDQ